MNLTAAAAAPTTSGLIAPPVQNKPERSQVALIFHEHEQFPTHPAPATSRPSIQYTNSSSSELYSVYGLLLPTTLDLTPRMVEASRI